MNVVDLGGVDASVRDRTGDTLAHVEIAVIDADGARHSTRLTADAARQLALSLLGLARTADLQNGRPSAPEILVSFDHSAPAHLVAVRVGDIRGVMRNSIAAGWATVTLLDEPPPADFG